MEIKLEKMGKEVRKRRENTSETHEKMEKILEQNSEKNR